jgi:hypothetical protein
MRSFEFKVSTNGIIFKSRFVKINIFFGMLRRERERERERDKKHRGTVTTKDKIYIYRKENHLIILESAEFS